MKLRSFAALAKALVFRPLLAEKARSLLTVAGIAIGVAVTVAIQLANGAAIRSFTESVETVAGRANYQIVSETAPIDERLLLALQPIWSAGGRFAPVIDLEVLLRPSDLPMRILAVDLLSDLHFRDYRYAKIVTSRNQTQDPLRGFSELFRDDSIIVPEPFARQHSLDLGSTIVIGVQGREVAMVVRGILVSEGPATAFNGSLGIVDIATAQRRFGMRGQLSRVDLLLPENEAVVSRVRSAMPPHARLERPSRRNERVGKMLRAFRVNLFALAAVALLVGVFLVYNTVVISVLRRRRDIGIARTLGTDSRSITVAFLLEGTIFGVVGSTIGVFLGYAMAYSILDVIGRTLTSLYVATNPSTVTLTPAAVLLALLLGTAVSVLAAAQPAVEAASLPPNALIRPGVYIRIAQRRIARLLFYGAAALTLAYIAAVAVPPIGGVSFGGYLSVLLIVVTLSFLSPAVLNGTSAAMTPLFDRFFRAIGRLAASTVPASLRRVAIATAALALSIGMMVAIAIMVGSFRETVRAWVGQTVKSDLWVRPAKGLSNAPIAVFPSEIGPALEALPFVKAIDRFRGKDIAYGDSIISLGSGDFDVSAALADLPMVAPRSASRAMRAAVAQRGVLVSEAFSLKFEKDAGDSVEVPTPRGLVTLPITGVYRDYSNDRGVVVMDRLLWVELFGDTSSNTVAVFLKEGVDPEKARTEIERVIGSRFRAYAFTNAEIRSEVMRIFDQTFAITYALLFVAISVAVLGIVNTLSALLLERRREIALLRVIGTSARQIRTMVVLESVVIGVAATLLGTLTGIALSYVLIFVINKQSFGWTIQFDPPLLVLALSLATTFAATVVAGLVPAALATRFDLAEDLKRE